MEKDIFDLGTGWESKLNDKGLVSFLEKIGVENLEPKFISYLMEIMDFDRDGEIGEQDFANFYRLFMDSDQC